MYLFIKITGIKGQLSGSSFMELGSFFGFVTVFFLHLQGVLFSWPLCRLHHQKKSQNSIFFFWKLNILSFRNILAGPVNLVKLAWKSRSQYLFEKNLLTFYIQPGQILVKRFFQMIFLAVFSKSVTDWHRQTNNMKENLLFSSVEQIEVEVIDSNKRKTLTLTSLME